MTSLKYSMIPLEYVARLAWSKDLGLRLQVLRGRLSRRALAEKVKARNVSCSHQGIQQIELGQWETVDLALILIMCEEIGVSIGHLLPTAKFSNQNNLLFPLDTY